MRTPTRTDLMDEHERKIQSMRFKAIDLTTTSRHYQSLADAIANIPSEGPFHVQAREDLMEVALTRRDACAAKAVELTAQADRMEAQGLD